MVEPHIMLKCNQRNSCYEPNKQQCCVQFVMEVMQPYNVFFSNCQKQF